MPILYSCVARGTTVLCSSPSGVSNYAEIVRSILPNIPIKTGEKKTYTSNNYEFHCLTENGLLFVCATESGVSKQQPYGFLSEIKRRFQSGTVSNRAEIAGQGELDKDFGFALSQQMQKFSQAGAGNSGSIAAVQAQVDEVKGVMSQNIERVLQRGDKLEDLMDKTEELEAGAATFQRTAKKIKTRYWWRNKKMTLILICVALIVIIVIVLIILFSTHVLPVKSDDDNKGTVATTVKP